MQKLLLLASLFLLAVTQTGIAQTHVQTKTVFQTSTATTVTCTFTSSSTSGNLIVAHVDWDNQSRKIDTITDNKGNVFRRINGPTNWHTNYRAELWYAYNITGGGAAIAVQAKLSGAPTSFFQIYISEYSGVATVTPLDQNAVAIGSTAAVSSGAKTITQANELVYGASIGATGTLTTGAGFTNRSTANSNIIEDRNTSVTGSYDAKFTSAGGNWIAQMATFRTTNIPLAVDLISFSGQCNNTNDKIALQWTTASEPNNAYFTIEESEEGRDWTRVDTLSVSNNTSIDNSYTYFASGTKTAFSYFRLKQTNLDGVSTYLKTIAVKNCHILMQDVSFYPNPCNGQTLYGKIDRPQSGAYTVEVYDNFGKIISRTQNNQAEFQINFQHTLLSGVYYARIVSSNYSAVKTFLVSH